MLLSDAIRKRTARQAPATPQRAAPAPPAVPNPPDAPPALPPAMPRYRVLGVDDEVVVCEKCGKSDLRCTIVLAVSDADGNMAGEVRFGRDCALRALGRRTPPGAAKKIEDEARTIERNRLFARRVSSQSVEVDHTAGWGKTYATVYSLEGGGKIAQVPEADLYPSRLRKLGGEWKTLGANWFVRR